MKRVAVVILNWNGRHFLEKFLPALVEHTAGTTGEIIVADNASTDDSIDFLKNKYPEIPLILLEKNYGFAEGYNKALEHLSHEYFLLLNSDIEVGENWLEPMVSFLDTHSEFAACGPVLLDYNHRTKYEYAGAAGGYMDKYGYTFCRGRVFNQVESADTIPGKTTEVFWTSGACMLVRSAVYSELDGLDPQFFAHMEEIDLCWRMKNHGYRLALVPESRVYHVGGGTLPKSNPFKTYLNFRNNLLLLYKNLPERLLRKTIRKRMLLDGVSGIMFMLTLKFKDLQAVLKAHRSYREMKPGYNRKNIPEALPSDVYMASVVFDYFLAGNKTFSQLRKNYGEEMNTRTID